MTLAFIVLATRGKKTLREASKESGISCATLSRIEKGELPDLRTFRLLCLWTGQSADYLLGLCPQDAEETWEQFKARARATLLAAADVLLEEERWERKRKAESSEEEGVLLMEEE